MSKKSREYHELRQEYTREGLIYRSRLADRIIQLGIHAAKELNQQTHNGLRKYLKTGVMDEFPEASEWYCRDRVSTATVIEASDLIGILGNTVDPAVEELPIALPCNEFFIEWRDGLESYGVAFYLYIYAADETREAMTFTGVAHGYSEAYCLKGNGDLVALNTGWDIEFWADSWRWGSVDREPSEATIATEKAIRVLRFLSMRNIELMDTPESPEYARAYERRIGVPCVKYKVLGIKTGNKRSSNNRERVTPLNLRSLHSVRGHIRHAPEHPIKQFAGAKYIRPHLRGNEKNGVIVKDYKVKPDEVP